MLTPLHLGGDDVTRQKLNDQLIAAYKDHRNSEFARMARSSE
jgi:hypothetical protein